LRAGSAPLLSLLSMLLLRRRPRSTLFPYTTLFRSDPARGLRHLGACQLSPVLARLPPAAAAPPRTARVVGWAASPPGAVAHALRSEEHTSELQSRENLVCRLLLEKKKEE